MFFDRPDSGEVSILVHISIDSECEREDPSEFEELSRDVMSKMFNTALAPGRVTGVHKQFDLVSDDAQIVGDAKYYTAVNGTGLPPAKFATIAEYVWLLEKAPARERFLVFGNDRRVPEWWLDRYGALTDVSFYYLSDDGELDLHSFVLLRSG